MVDACLASAVDGRWVELLGKLCAMRKCCGGEPDPHALRVAAEAADDGCLDVLLREFTWEQKDLEKAKLVARDVGFMAGVTKLEAVQSILQDAPTHSMAYSSASLVEAARQGFANQVTAVLSTRDDAKLASNDDLFTACEAAAKTNHVNTLSRIVFFIKTASSSSDVDYAMGVSFVSAASAGSADVASTLLRTKKLTKEFIQKGLVQACSHGQESLLLELLRITPLRTDDELKSILIAGAVRGQTQTLITVNNFLPQRKLVIEDLARHAILRCSKTGDAKTAAAFAALLTTETAGGTVAAAVVAAKKNGFDDVLVALKPLKRGVSSFTPGLSISLIDMNDDVFDHIFLYLDLSALSHSTITCKRFSTRIRTSEQFVRCLINDYMSYRYRLPYATLRMSSASPPIELLRLAGVISSFNSATAYQMETVRKRAALDRIIAVGVMEDWPDIDPIVAYLAKRSAEADTASVTEMLLNLKLKNGEDAISPQAVLEVFKTAIKNERLRVLGAVLRTALPSKRLRLRSVVEKCREEATAGSASIVSLLLAALSKEAMSSRRAADALAAKRRWEFEQRGGIWGIVQMQQERELHLVRTTEEVDFDDALGSSMRRAAVSGHTTILSGILKLLKARGRLGDFDESCAKSFEDACRCGHVQVLGELLSMVPINEKSLKEGLSHAIRNGELNVAKMLVTASNLSNTIIHTLFVDSARRGHDTALKTLLQTGCVGGVSCQMALDEVIRRDHTNCMELLLDAVKRLKELEEEEVMNEETKNGSA